MEQKLQSNVVRVFDDKTKKAEAPIISNEKLESQKKTAISDQINYDIAQEKKVEDRVEFRDSEEAKRKEELTKKNAFLQPKKKNLVDQGAFKGSKNVQTNQRQVNRTRNSNGTISVVIPKLDLTPKGNGSGKRFT